MAQAGHDNGTTLKIVRDAEGHPDPMPVDNVTEELASPPWISRDQDVEEWNEELPSSRWLQVINILLVAFALLWVSLVSITLFTDLSAYDIHILPIPDITTFTLPLILLGMVWLMLNRSGSAESRRLDFAARKLQREAAGLDSVLAMINGRIASHNNQIREQADGLAALGETTVSRLAQSLGELHREQSELDILRVALDNATSAAGRQVELLLHDLPKAVQQSQSMTDAMEQAGSIAREQALAIESQLTALCGLASDSEREVGNVAQKLSVQISQIETASEAASTRIAGVAADLDKVIDSHLGRTSMAADDLRSLITEQAKAIAALSDQSRAGLTEAATAGVAALHGSLEALEKRLATLDSQAAGTGAVHRAELEQLADALDENIRAVASLHERGTAQATSLTDEIKTGHEQIKGLMSALDASRSKVAQLAGEAGGIEQQLHTMTALLNDNLPGMISRVDELTTESLSRIAASLPELERAEVLGTAIGQALDDNQKTLKAHNRVAELLASRTRLELEKLKEQVGALQTDLDTISTSGSEIAGQTAPRLLEALIRVRETAEQAADKARQAIFDVIPQVSHQLAEESGEALAKVIGNSIEDKIFQIQGYASDAVDAAQKASEQLVRQMLTIADTTAGIEQRLQEAAAEREEHENETLSRRVAALIEALNSTSIDVTKLLSNEVTDTAWAAYLKGDRGVFTRRAVRLLDTGEARSILHHYNDDPEFRDQVNRYIHDFEAMLRQVLATRDGQLMSVTLLSSDMGKLYVALAQAIERLRT